MTELKPIIGVEPVAKFMNPDRTAKGEPRATVALKRLETLWINTGTLCNITCRNCYIESSPTNDRLAYISAAEVLPFLTEARDARHARDRFHRRRAVPQSRVRGHGD